jgi:hypothetical protein
MRFVKKIIIFLAFVFLAIWLVSLFAPKSKNIEYGITFSHPYSEGLGLDWKKTYISILDELKPKYIRLSAYWNTVEPKKGAYNFSELDFQVGEASARNTKIVLGIGRRLPRWPECHDPEWIKSLSPETLKNDQLSYIEAVVRRYQGNPNIISWQVENEAFVSVFGPCPKVDVEFLDSEIALVKKLDPPTPITITDSGELSFGYAANGRGDIFGTTLYRYVYNDVFNTYWTNHIPALFYRFKAGFFRLLRPDKKVVIMELQAEPWTTKGILDTSIEEQFKTMSMEKFSKILSVAEDTGFSPQYLWGAEWWYWMKTQGHPEFWERAKELMQN